MFNEERYITLRNSVDGVKNNPARHSFVVIVKLMLLVNAFACLPIFTTANYN